MPCPLFSVAAGLIPKPIPILSLLYLRLFLPVSLSLHVPWIDRSSRERRLEYVPFGTPVCDAVSRPSVFYFFQLLFLDVDLLYRHSLSLIQIRDDRTRLAYLLLSVNSSL
ncbi:hypothetical protein BJ166DRAFT_235152 [Pestalotiopsis sp. NC0098]|nr:hypothetical protein BJ166DRAFT_235152 [Pestalotiopsis sp. NC0098]